jgi:DNA-binding beta-propeller fold protein YncE
MPHGSRFTPDGLFQYSSCMMDDQLVEIDARAFEVSRRFSLAKGKEGPVDVNTTMSGMGGMSQDAHARHGAASAATATGTSRVTAPVDPAQLGGAALGMKHDMAPNTCSPTWSQPSVDGRFVYVACNKGDEIVEVSRASWSITRRFPTGRGVYNLATTPDGKMLVATLKQGSGIELFDLVAGRSVAQLKTSTTLAHGVAVSSDSRYAFVSSEGVGSAPGKVDVVDLAARRIVGTADVGPQASGIAYWKSEPITP